jgi:hypothetical protein
MIALIAIFPILMLGTLVFVVASVLEADSSN